MAENLGSPIIKPSNRGNFLETPIMEDLNQSPLKFTSSQHNYNPQKRKWTGLTFSNNGTADIEEVLDFSPSKRACQETDTPPNSPEEVQITMDDMESLLPESDSTNTDIPPQVTRGKTIRSPQDMALIKEGFAATCTALRSHSVVNTNCIPPELLSDEEDWELQNWSWSSDEDECQLPREGATPPHPEVCDCRTCLERAQRDFDNVMEDVKTRHDVPKSVTPVTVFSDGTPESLSSDDEALSTLADLMPHLFPVGKPSLPTSTHDSDAAEGLPTPLADSKGVPATPLGTQNSEVSFDFEGIWRALLQLQGQLDLLKHKLQQQRK